MNSHQAPFRSLTLTATGYLPPFARFNTNSKPSSSRSRRSRFSSRARTFARRQSSSGITRVVRTTLGSPLFAGLRDFGMSHTYTWALIPSRAIHALQDFGDELVHVDSPNLAIRR